MSIFRRLVPLAALIGLASVAPATAADVARVANTATLSYDASSGRQTLSSNTVSLDVDRSKLPTKLSFHLLPVGYTPVGMTCETSPSIRFTPGPIDEATLAAAPLVETLDINVPLILELDNPGGNHDPNVRETSIITITTESYSGQLPLLETGPNTGVFAGAVPAGGDANPALAPCDPTLVRGEHLKLSFAEDAYSLASETSILVDPAGYVFDSSTGTLIDGARVTLLDANDQPAVVFGDDGVSRYPSSVISGASVTDASGRIYRQSQGNFRFPRVAPGRYHLVIEPPGSYTAPSTKSLADLAKLKDPTGRPFLINDASFGRVFTVTAPDPFYADVPLDLAGNTSLLLTKTASVREASPGDFVQYRVSLVNRSKTAATNVRLTDLLPVGLRYEIGSTRGAPEPTVSKDGRNLSFTLASVAAGGSLDLRYVVTIAPGAPTGDAVNRVLASGSGGATGNEAAAAVRIRPLLFTDGFALIGRITEGACGDPGRGRTGIAGIRLFLEDGTFVVTDKDGFYHFEGIRPGRHVVQMDTGSIPVSYEPVACDTDTRTAGSAISRFVEADGGLLKRVDFQLRPTGKVAAATVLPVDIASDKNAAGDRDWFAGQAPGVEMLFPTADYNPRAPVTRVVVKHLVGQRVALRVNGELVDPINFDTTDVNDDKSIALSRWSGLSLKEGDNVIEAKVLGADGSVVTTITRIVHSSSIPARATLVPEKSRLVADGLARPLIAVRVTDSAGRPVRAGTLVPFAVDQPYTAAIEAELEQGNQLAGRDRAQTTARVVGDDGLAFIALQPTTQAGNVHVVVSLPDDKQVRTSDVRVWLSGAARDWIVVGFGSGTIGYDTLSARTTSLPRGTKDGVVTDGQLAFYAKGRVKGSWLLTIAYNSDRKLDRSRGLLGTIDPDRYYTVYGDGSRQGYDAPTEGKLYVRLERRDFYALFGDFETGLNETQLGRYSRTLNGVKAEYQGNVVSFTAFAARNSQLHARDEIQGNGLSGPYRLTGRNIVPNSDQLRIEVRDRLRPELVLTSTQMTRHIDYDIDPVTGTIRFREPVLGRDANLNPVFIVVDYETEGGTAKLTAGARATVKLAKGKVQLGATVLRDESVGSGDGTLAAIDIRAKPSATTEIRGEAAMGGQFGFNTGRAWLAEVEHHSKAVDLLLYARSQDLLFGLGQQNLVEGGTRKFGIDTRVKIARNLAFTATAWNSQQLVGPGSRTAADVRLEYQRGGTTMFVGGQFADDQSLDGQKRQSRLLTLGGSQALFKGALTLSGQVQFAPGGDKASVDFPIRQQIQADWRVAKGIRLIAGYEIADGKDFDARTARVGFDVSPWKGAKLMSTLNQQGIGENGQRTYAQYGMSQSLPLGKHWTIDATLDASKTLRGSIPDGAFINAFATSANGSIASNYQNDGDYIAVTGGAAYSAKLWSWNGRVEYRDSEKTNRWSITSNVLRSLGQGRTLAGSFRYSDVTDKNGARAASIAADVALAVRPPDSRWSVLDRLQFRKDSADAGFTDANVLGVPSYNGAFQATLRVINNLSLNYRTGDEGRGHGFEGTVYYGAKWVKGSFGADDYTGYVDVVGFDLRKDLGSKLDIGVQGSVQHAWDRGTFSFSGGPSLGVSPAPNLWVSAGYNVSGYRDRDFENDRYTRAGPYLTLRLKFDQTSLGKAGRTIFGIGR